MSSSRPSVRRGWPIRIFRLGAEPSDDLSGSTTAGERLAMMWPLAVEAWHLAGRHLPRYSRDRMPIHVVRNPDVPMRRP